MSNLDRFKSEVARLFFSLPASSQFLLAGGGALLASGLSTRPTEDLDFFGSRATRDVATVSRIFELAAAREGWGTKPLRRSEHFVRLKVEGPETIAIDFCTDTQATLPVVHTSVGPTYSGPELGGRKMLALFSRAEARDFVDVFELARVFGKETLFARAKRLDAGFGRQPFCEAVQRLAIYDDFELPIDQTIVGELRRFFQAWTDELSA